MSDRDPHVYARPLTPRMHGNQGLNPIASSYTPEVQPLNRTLKQVRVPPSSYLEARILKLEEDHSDLRGEVVNLTELYDNLCSSLDKLKKGGSPVTTGPFPEQDPIQSHQSALEFKHKLEQLSCKDDKSVAEVTDVLKLNNTAMSKTNVSVPPHLRGKRMNG
jgi:hypothetical protein